MREVFKQKISTTKPEKAKLESISIDRLKEEFEKRWGENRGERFVVQEQDGKKTIFEVYHLSINKFMLPAFEEISEFLGIAAVIGYRSPIGPITVPNMKPTLAGGSRWTEPSVFICLERTEQDS